MEKSAGSQGRGLLFTTIMQSSFCIRMSLGGHTTPPYQHISWIQQRQQ